MKPLNIGLVGYGGIGRVHGLAYRAINFHYALPADTVNVVGVATTRMETAEKGAKEVGCDFFTDDYRKLLERDDIDVIDCTTPNNSHKEIVIAAAEAGKHIYCEKPLAMSPDEARAMAEAVEKAGVKSQVTFNLRFIPAVLRAKQLLEEGFVGNIFSFRGRYHRASYISYDKPLSWRLRREVTGGGALFDLGSHIIDLLYYLLGDFSSVNATLDTLIKERPVSAGASEKAPVDVDDFAMLQARLKDDTPGVVEVSRMGTGATNDVIVEIFGDKGAIRFDLNDPAYLYVYDVRDGNQPIGGMRGFKKIETVQRYDGAKAPDWTMTPGFMRAHTECQYQFLKAISDDTPTAPNFRDGLHIQQIMAAAEKSSDEGGWVPVAEM